MTLELSRNPAHNTLPDIPGELPLLPLRHLLLAPGMILPLFVSEVHELQAVERALKSEGYLFLALCHHEEQGSAPQDPPRAASPCCPAPHYLTAAQGPGAGISKAHIQTSKPTLSMWWLYYSMTCSRDDPGAAPANRVRATDQTQPRHVCSGRRSHPGKRHHPGAAG
jgi:hypothetical protein